MHQQDEITIRDIVVVLRKNLRWLIVLPLISLAIAALVSFLLLENVYTSQATLSLSTEQIQAQLEQRIQVQQTNLLPFEAVRAVAYSEDVILGVWQALKNQNLIPKKWDSNSPGLGFDRMVRDLKVREQPAKRTENSDSKVLIIHLSVNAPSPLIASKTANLWADRVVEAINKVPFQRLEKSLSYLQNSLEEAQEQYQKAQANWLRVSRNSSLNSDKMELEQLSQERVRLDQAIASAIGELNSIKSRQQAFRKAIQAQRAQVSSNISPDQIALINRSFEEALKSLSAELNRYNSSYEQAAQALESFRKRERITEVQLQLERISGRLADIKVSLGSIATEKAQKQAALDEIEAQISKEPRLVEVLREVVADPVAAAAVARGDWTALESLRLKTQEFNPVYTPLYNRAVELKASLVSLETSEQALRAEQDQLSQQLAVSKQLLAVQLRERDRLDLESKARKAAYEALRSRYEQLSRLSAQQLAFESPNPEYLRLRSALIDVEAEQAGLEGKLVQLQNRLGEVAGKILVLRDRVARAQVDQDNAQQALEVSKNAYLAMTQKKTDLELQSAASQELAQTLVRAYPVYEKTSPNRALILLVAVALGFMIALVWVFLLEAMQGSQDRERQPAFSTSSTPS